MTAMELFSRNVAYPLWNLKDRSHKLREYGRLQKSQWRSAEEVQSYQLGRLQAILEHAYTTVPYYRKHWERNPVACPIDSLDDMRDFPVLSKKDVREFQDTLISDRYRKAELVEAKTGGSTGVALELYFDERCQEYRNAAAMMVDGWAGWRPGMLMGALWGTPPIPETIKQKVRNLFYDRVFYLDTMDLNPESMGAFLAEFNRRKPEALFGHAHSLYVFACFIEKENMELPPLKAIVSTSMMLLPSQRSVMERIFKIAVTNRYGCEEVGLIACECEEHDGLHINSDHLLVELLDEEGETCTAGAEGRLVLTDFNNFGMPMVRYEVGDIAVSSTRSCPCGRGLPLIDGIVGRTADYLVRSDGSLVSGISLVEKTLTAIPGIEQMQIVQENLSRVVINIVKGVTHCSSSDQALSEYIKTTFGSSTVVDIRHVDDLDRVGNGKYRFAVCNVSLTSENED